MAVGRDCSFDNLGASTFDWQKQVVCCVLGMVVGPVINPPSQSNGETMQMAA